jgi:hypothetical protein
MLEVVRHAARKQADTEVTGEFDRRSDKLGRISRRPAAQRSRRTVLTQDFDTDKLLLQPKP